MSNSTGIKWIWTESRTEIITIARAVTNAFIVSEDRDLYRQEQYEKYLCPWIRQGGRHLHHTLLLVSLLLVWGLGGEFPKIGKISGMIWISEPYRIFKSGVKLHARKMGLWDNKKGKSIGSDSPFWVVIKIEYRRFFKVSKLLIWVSGARGFHPYALQDPYVTVSRHTAPTVQPMAESQIPKTQIAWVHGVQCDLTSGSHWASGLSAFCISASPNEPKHTEADGVCGALLICNICHNNLTNP